MTGTQPGHPGHRRDPLPSPAPPAEAARLASFLREHPCWSAFWDKKYQVWRVAEDDPDSDLYAEAARADQVIGYMTAHS
jgi:hypothetical protein